jgi:hypothetical protein
MTGSAGAPGACALPKEKKMWRKITIALLIGSIFLSCSRNANVETESEGAAATAPSVAEPEAMENDISAMFPSPVAAQEIILNIDINNSNDFDNTIKEYYDGLELGYIKSDTVFESYGEIYFSIDKINYYGLKKDVKLFLGYADATGVYDKDLKLIKPCPFIPTEFRVNKGLSSIMLNDPFEPSIVIHDTQRNGYSNTDPFVIITIDFEKNTLIIFEPNIEV